MSAETTPAPFDMTGWKAVAALFDVHVRTAQRWARKRGMPVSRRWYVIRARRAELIAWEADQNPA